MKNIISQVKSFVLYMMLPLATMLGSCSKDDPFFSASEDDSPRILNTDIPEDTTSSVSGNYDENFYYEIIVTPANYTKVEWYENGKLFYTGNVLDSLLSMGNHHFKIKAITTKGKETSRVLNVDINGASISGAAGDRWVYPGSTVQISGNAISLITKVLVGGVEATNVSVSEGYLSFTLPEVGEGTFPLVIIDSKGNEFEQGDITISKINYPLVNETSIKTKKNTPVELTGVNLNKVQSVKVDGKEVELMYTPEFGRIGFICPLLSSGEYPITATDIDGKNVVFGADEAEFATLTVQNEDPEPVEAGVILTLWEGSFEMPDWTPVDTWNAAVTELVNNGTLAVGSKIQIYIQRTATDYCSIAPINSSWVSVVNGKADPDRADLGAEMETEYVEFEVTDATIAAIKEAGFYLAGHGYTVKKLVVSVPSYTIWTGTVEMPDWTPVDTWNAAVTQLVNNGTINVGNTIEIFIQRTASDYCVIAPINSSWVSVVNGKADPDRADLNAEMETESVEFAVIDATIAAIKEAGFYLAGHGYTVKKLVVK